MLAMRRTTSRSLPTGPKTPHRQETTVANKTLKSIDLLEAIAESPLARAFDGATIDSSKRTAETADLLATIDVVTSKDVAWDQEYLRIHAKTDKGVALMAPEEKTRVALFNYAHDLRARSNVTSKMKAAAEGPEKAMAKAEKTLAALASVLTPEQLATLLAKVQK
jgi:hypothetical protein